jgi:DNA-binding protein YbaB
MFGMSTDPPKLETAPVGVGEVSERLQRFVEAAGSFEASADDLVRVRVGSAMNVVSVELLDPDLDSAAKQRLETAIVGAINTAMQRAVLGAGQALADLEKMTAARPRSARTRE